MSSLYKILIIKINYFNPLIKEDSNHKVLSIYITYLTGSTWMPFLDPFSDESDSVGKGGSADCSFRGRGGGATRSNSCGRVHLMSVCSFS